MHTEPGSARDEAERLIAAVIAAVSTAGRAASRSGGADGPLGSLGSLGGAVFSAAGHIGSAVRGASGGAIATGSAECCVCPVCRVIAALRDPSPEFAERLSTGAGDFAVGVASLLRALNAAAGATGPATQPRPATQPPPAERPRPAGGSARPDEAAWRTATRDTDGSRPAPQGESDPWAAATADPPAAPADAPAVPAARKPMARKAVRRSVVKKVAAEPAAERAAEPAAEPAAEHQRGSGRP